MTANNETAPPTTALAVRDPDAPRAIVPTSIGEAINLATELAKSSLVDASYRAKQADVLHIVLAGQELGLPPMASLRLFYVEKGLPKLYADGLVALVMAHRDVCEYFRPVTLTATSASFATRRRGEPEQRYEYTVAMATHAGLMTKSTWKADPGMMCAARAKARLAKLVYPDLVAGVRIVEDDYDGDEAPAMPHVAPPPPSREPRSRRGARSEPSPAPPPQEDAIDAEYTEVPTAGQAPTPSVAPGADSSGAAASSGTVLSSSGPVVESSTETDQFGADDASRSIDPIDAELERFRADCEGAKTADDLKAVRGKWLEWSKRPEVKARNAHQAMGEIYAQRKARLPMSGGDARGGG